jgi:23S rRNA pseudouridine1911/1915/1917 synthase
VTSDEQLPKRRLGRAAHELLGGSYSHAKREVEIGHVTVNGTVVADPGAWVSAADRVRHNPSLPRRTPPPRVPPIEVLHADADVVVVVKPAGLVVHPTIEDEDDTVITRTVAALARREGRPGRVLVVHRIDRDTSGVMVLARNQKAAKHLNMQFKAHSVERRYLAFLRGDFAAAREVDRGIGRPRPGARRAALGEGRGREARTHLRPIERFGVATLVEAELDTGRTHQVRVHASWLEHPVLGDAVYGGREKPPVPVPRLALHAAHLGFVHPSSGRRLSFEAPLPGDLKAVARALRRRARAQPPPSSEAPPRGRGERRPSKPAKRRARRE